MTLRDLTILGCSSQQPTRKRNHGAYLFRWNGEGLLFDPGEGTQRQFIFANVAPTCVNRMFISHFHGDHCLGVGSMLMRLNLDKVTHPIHCYYPASGQVYFDRLRHGTIYHQTIQIIEHPIKHEGLVEEDGNFRIEARFLEHGVENIGWRITEKDTRKFDQAKLLAAGVKGPNVRTLEEKGEILIDGRKVLLDDVSHIKLQGMPSPSPSTPCPAKPLSTSARGTKLFLCESTLPGKRIATSQKNTRHHLTAKQAAEIAKSAEAERLILTHFSARYQDAEDFAKEARPIFPNTQAAEDLKVFLF